MRVPVRRAPETRVSEQQQGYARPVQPLNVEPITRLVEGFRDQLLDEQDDRQRVELNRRLIEEVNGLTEDFEVRRRNPEESPVDFADRTNTAYSERHTALIDELRQNGYRQELLDDFGVRLGTVRQGFFERGLGHQMTQLRSRAIEEIETTATASSQYAAVDPMNNYVTARDTFRESVRTSPDLMEDERAQQEDTGTAIIRDGAARALAIQNPQLIIDTLDPQGLTAPARSSAATSTPAGPAPAATGWQGVATTVANELGLPADEVAAVMSYETAGTFSPTIMGGTGGRYMGLIQFGPEERRTYGITAQSTPEQWSTAILSFMRDRGFRRGMSLLDFYSTINAGRPGRYNASDGPGNTVRRHVDRILAEHRTPAAAWLAQGMPAVRAGESAAGGSQLTGEGVEVVEVPASSSERGVTVPSPPAPANDISGIRTGNALLDDLSGPERLQILGLAREQLTRTTASQRAAMDVTLGNIRAEAMNNGGEIATPIPAEAEVLRVYGAVEGPQRWAQIQQSRATGRAITAFRTLSGNDIQGRLDALRPQPGSPTYATQLEVYQNAERAAQALLTERQQDPAAYAMRYFPAVREAAQQGTSQYYAALDRVYETLGIDSRSAPVMSANASRQMTERYRAMSPSQRREFMRDNMAQMGEDRFRRFIHGMEGTTVETDADLFGYFRTFPGTAGQVGNLYHEVLEGRDAIEQDSARRPRSEAVATHLRTGTLPAIRSPDLNPSTSRTIQTAAEALYVRRGGNDGNGNFNAERYNQALTEVLGGSLPVAMGHGQAASYQTILPPRINRQQFEGWIERQTTYSISRAGGGDGPYYGDLRTAVPAEMIIDQGAFVMVTPGRYMIRMASDGQPLMRSNGRPFIMNIDPREIVNARAGAGVVR